jgi:dTDP-4-dehydrorhamnose reductase
MKILLLGKNDQAGRELQRSLAPLGELVALDRQKVDGLFGDLPDLLRLSKELETLSVIADQIGVPTGADPIADVTALAIQRIRTRKEFPGIRYVLAELANRHRTECLGSSQAADKYKKQNCSFNEQHFLLWLS